MAVVGFDIARRQTYSHGYERLDGTLHLAFDPSIGSNRAIVDLGLAARDADGLVHARAGLCLLRPVDSNRSNRRLLVYVVNRGRLALPMNRPPPQSEPSDEIHPGDGFLLRHGWSVALCGWQWDVAPAPGQVGLEAPEAVGPDGEPLRGRVLIQFQPNEPHPDELLSHMPLHPAPGRLSWAHRPYPAADVDEVDAEMTVRDWLNGPRTTIPRERWRFARHEDGRPVPDDTRVWLEGGFEAGKIYEVAYTTRSCPVVGTGMLAIRDCASYLRHGDAASGNPLAGGIDRAYAFGVSQCGRFLRQYLYDAVNLDEVGRPAFDGILIDVAGARRGEFNHRFAQPSSQHALGFGHLPPFTTDEIIAPQRRAGGAPRVIEVNTSSEYWRIDCSLIHTDPTGTRDVEPPSDARIYMLAGSQHGPGSLPLNRAHQTGARAANDFDVVDYMVLVRASLIHLDRWVSEGVEPPPSAFPRLADGTAVSREAVLAKLAAIPGIVPLDPRRLPTLLEVDLGPRAAEGVGEFPPRTGSPYRSYVSDVDADGNEIAGIRLPDLTVPVGTHAGWVARDPATGGAGQLVDMQGLSLPLPPTAGARAATGDPRRSIAERYPSREAYLARAREEAERLAASRYLLEEDVEAVVAACAERYDAFAPRLSGVSA